MNYSTLFDELKNTRIRLSQKEKECEKLRDALEHIVEYWNRDRNEDAMFDACWHAIETAEAALKETETD